MICDGCFNGRTSYEPHACKRTIRLYDRDNDLYFQKCSCAVETLCASWEPVRRIMRQTA